jgi:predicted DNA-binding protein
MNTAQTQIKLNLPLALKGYLESKANKFGMPIAGYIKHLILKDIEDMDYPTFQASEETEKAYQTALEEHKSGKITKVSDIDAYFNKL